jgi:NAD+ synthase (glutamine-hydrolysing)
VRTFRISNKSFQKESHGVSLIPRVHIDLSIANNSEDYIYDSPQHRAQLQRRRELYEFPHATFEPSAYLWDVLRKSRARGFFLPLSGGLDSCTVALIVYNMCYLLYQQISSRSYHSQQILDDLRKVLREKDYTPQSPQEMCSRILFTAYLATENSSESTRTRAKKIS